MTHAKYVRMTSTPTLPASPSADRQATDHAHSHGQLVPKQMLYACFALISFSVTATFASQFFGVGSFEREDSAIVAERQLHFRDREDGGISVFDAQTAQSVHEFSPSEGGFVRVTMRAHALARRTRGLGGTSPVSLVRTAEGRLLLSDPTTGREIGLEAFGPQNKAIFDVLLASPQTAPPTESVARRDTSS